MSIFMDSHQRQYQQLAKRLTQASAYKLGYPESLLSSEAGGRLVDHRVLGIEPGSLADQLIVNVGSAEKDSEIFDLEVKDIEREVIEIMSRYLCGDKKHVTGYVTSGGTEGNFVSLWWARRKLAGSTLGGKPPVLIYTEQSSHYSIAKIGEQLGLQCLPVCAAESGSMAISDFVACLDELLSRDPDRKVIVAANIGTTLHGAIDDISAIKTILVDRQVDHCIHADAALLGMVLPVLQPFGGVANIFRDLGIDTMAISGHKFLGTPLACGMVLADRNFLQQAFQQDTSVEYAGYIEDITFSGCRSGLAVLMIHNALRSLNVGTERSQIPLMVQRCLANAEYLYGCLVKLLGHGNVAWIPKQFNVVFKRPSMALMKRYRLMPKGDKAVVCVLMNVSCKLLAQFIEDYAFELGRQTSVA